MKFINVAGIVAIICAAGSFALKGEMPENVTKVCDALAKPDDLTKALNDMESNIKSEEFNSIKSLTDDDKKKAEIRKLLTAEKLAALKSFDPSINKYEQVSQITDPEKVQKLGLILTSAEIDLLKAKNGYIGAKNLENTLMKTAPDAKEDKRLNDILDVINAKDFADFTAEQKQKLKLTEINAKNILLVIKVLGKSAIDEMDELIDILGKDKELKEEDIKSAKAAKASSSSSTGASSVTGSFMDFVKDNYIVIIFVVVGLVVLVAAAFIMTRKSDPTDL